MAKVTKKSKLNNSDKMLTLFEHKLFTLLFFFSIFALLGGALYLMQSTA